MCFSASASFTASALLIPTGIYCLKEAAAKDKTYLAIASVPLFFGIQQAFEGLLWLGFASDQTNTIHSAALGFLFFSNFFWLFWIPGSAYSVETNQLLKKVLAIFTLVGFIYGACLYLPLLNYSDWLEIQVINHSIFYQIHFFFNNQVFLPKDFSWIVYMMIVLIPLFICSNRSFNLLGVLMFISAISTYLVFSYAFISVWCFFAAIISIYLIYIINQLANSDSKQLLS
jgi:hypothetical protein